MYKSLYDYKTGDKTQLKVRTGQTFEFVKAHDEHWWLMTCQENGKTGLVPSSFLTELKQKTTLVCFISIYFLCQKVLFTLQFTTSDHLV